MATKSRGRAEAQGSDPSEKVWMVNLYRWTMSNGWEKQVPVRVRDDGTEIKTSKGRSDASFSVAVVPQKHHILLPDFQQKFTLANKSDDSSNKMPGAGVDADERLDKTKHDDEKKWVKDRTTIIRREDRILLISRRRIQSMVIKFRNLSECLEFSDYFLQLNRSPEDSKLSSTERATKSNPTCPTDDERACELLSSHQGFGGHQQAIMSYVTRLIHDEDFLKFVHKLESCIERTDDGKAILEALSTRPVHSKSIGSTTEQYMDSKKKIKWGELGRASKEHQ